MRDDLRSAKCSAVSRSHSCGKTGGNGLGSQHECADERYSGQAGDACQAVRLLCEHGKESNQESRGKRRFRVDEDGTKFHPSLCEAWKSNWKSGSTTSDLSDSSLTTYQEKKKDAVGAGYSPKHTGRRRTQAAGKKRKKASKEIAKQYKKELQDRATPAEVCFQNILLNAGINHKFQQVMKNSSCFYIVDFYLPQYAAVVEIDGGYHNTGEQEQKDKHRTNVLIEKNGVAVVVRFKNEEVFCGSEYVLQKLAQALVPWAPMWSK